MTAIRLKKAWKIWQIGHVIPDMPENLATALIARGIGEAVTKSAPSPVREIMSLGKRANYVTKG